MEILKGIIAVLITDPATGGIFAVLILGIVGMGYFGFRTQKQNVDQSKNHDKMVEEYTKNLIEVINKSHERDKITTKALQDIRLVLAEMQGRLNH